MSVSATPMSTRYPKAKRARRSAFLGILTWILFIPGHAVRLHSTVSFPSCKSPEPRPYLTNSSTVTDPLSSAIFAQLPPIRLIISSISCGQRRAYIGRLCGGRRFEEAGSSPY
jgi:hypothetical protein